MRDYVEVSKNDIELKYSAIYHLRINRNKLQFFAVESNAVRYYLWTGTGTDSTVIFVVIVQVDKSYRQKSCIKYTLISM